MEENKHKTAAPWDKLGPYIYGTKWNNEEDSENDAGERWRQSPIEHLRGSIIGPMKWR